MDHLRAELWRCCRGWEPEAERGTSYTKLVAGTRVARLSEDRLRSSPIAVAGTLNNCIRVNYCLTITLFELDYKRIHE